MRELLAVGIVVLLVLAALSMATTLRWRYRDRERLRRQLLDDGRTIVAEVPAAEGFEFFSEDADAFYWSGQTIPKRAIRAAQLLISGAPLAAVHARGAADPGAESAAADRAAGLVERERWDVSIETAGATVLVACGSIRQQVSQELARRIFDAVRTAVAAQAPAAAGPEAGSTKGSGVTTASARPPSSST